MKRVLLPAGLSFVFFGGFAQCSFTAALRDKGEHCAGSAMLSITARGTLAQITWYRDNTPVRTVNAAAAGHGITVAGGGGEGTGADQLEGPEGISMDAQGNIYISDAANYRVQKWARGAVVGVTVAGGHGQGTAANQLDGHASVYVDGVGDLFVADASNHRIQKWPPGAITGITVAGGNGQGAAAGQFDTPEGVFVDDRMNVFVADAGNNRIQEWAPGVTQGITIAGGNGQGTAANQFNVSSSLYIDSRGNIFVSDYGNDRVQKWAPGAVAGVTVAGGNGQGDAANQLNDPESVYVDAGDTVYVADLANNRVQKWAPGASIGVTVAGGNGLGASPNQLAFPYSVFVDDSGYVYVSDFGNNRIQKWAQAAVIDTTYQPDAAGIYYAVVTDASGCSATTETIAINPPPEVMAGDDTILEPGQRVHLHPIVTGPVVAYQWTPSAGLNDPSIADPVAGPIHTTSYQLTVVTDSGCSASGKLAIQVYYTLRMPNAFTPDGGGKNDVFRVPASAPQEIVSFSVYNRLGYRVFMTADGSSGWDGSCNNHPQPAGVYIWEVEYKDLLSGKLDKATGTVVLIR